MKFNTIHKIRFDRGRTYYSYFQAIITALLVWIFSQGNWINSIISGLAAFILIYIFGFIDDKLGIIDKEQEIYSKKNKVIMKIFKNIEEINKKIENKKYQNTDK